MDRSALPVAIIGSGPVGLAAAAHLVARGETPLLFESGATVAASVRSWGHVRLFSPWEFNIDPVAAERMEPSNRRRVLRALEVTLGSGTPFSSFGPGLGEHPETRYDQIGVWLPRDLLAERIRIAAQDLRGKLPRRINFFPSTGRVAVRKLHQQGDALLVQCQEQALATALLRQQDSGKGDKPAAWSVAAVNNNLDRTA